MSCGVGCRHHSELALLWLWRRLAATALSRGAVPACRELLLLQERYLPHFTDEVSETWRASLVDRGAGLSAHTSNSGVHALGPER